MTAAREPEGMVKPATLAVLRPGLWHRVYADHKAASLRALPVSAFDALLAERYSLADELRRVKEALTFCASGMCEREAAGYESCDVLDSTRCRRCTAVAALTPPREERP